jgi:hypothetical protein
MSVIYQNKTYKAKRKNGQLTLNLSGKKITEISSIKGLEDLQNLDVLNLNNNQISEIEGLEALRNLKVLILSNNSISEVRSLENLTKLNVLILNKNPIHTLKGLDALVNLRRLDLYNCKIDEIESFDNKRWLNTMALGKNPIYSDFSKVIKKKKKLRKMTEEQRNQKNIDPKLYQIADNTDFQLIYRKKQESDQKNKISAGSNIIVFLVVSFASCFVGSMIGLAINPEWIGWGALIGFFAPLLIKVIWDQVIWG